MSLDAVLEQARRGRLYPAAILYGANPERRQDAALRLARVLLCRVEPAETRPCGTCKSCRRIAWAADERLHPDVHILERDLRTTTSIDATKRFLQTAYSAPFEGPGQVFILAEAESLSGGAADALLKILEEPPSRTPRHFFLLAASRLDLLPTVRSRSLEVYLGVGDSLDEAALDQIGGRLGTLLDGYFESRSGVLLLAVAETLQDLPGWDDPRARKPWSNAAAALLRAAQERARDDRGRLERRALLDLSEALLDAWRLRLRGISPGRILEGLLVRHLVD